MSLATTGMQLLVGSLLFWGASFLPINQKLYSQESPQGMLEVTQTHAGGWRLSNSLFILGALITALGIWFLGGAVEFSGNDLWRFLGIYGFLAGVLLSVWFLGARMLSPESYILLDGSKPWLLHISMGVMTLAILGLGMFLRGTDLADWLGLTTLILGGLFVVFHIAMKDQVPMFHYLPTLILGVYLLVKN